VSASGTKPHFLTSSSDAGQAEQTPVHVVARCRRHNVVFGHVHGQTRRKNQVPERLEAAAQHQHGTQRVRGGEHRPQCEHAFDDEHAPR
jgi:hypothetical protein